jgi:hypothetical protein
MESEAGHYTTFITYARKYGEGIDVETRWREWLAFKSEIITSYGKSDSILGSKTGFASYYWLMSLKPIFQSGKLQCPQLKTYK